MCAQILKHGSKTLGILQHKRFNRVITAQQREGKNTTLKTKQKWSVFVHVPYKSAHSGQFQRFNEEVRKKSSMPHAK